VGSLPLSILDAATETPDRIAAIVAGESWTYRAIAERVCRVLQWLDDEDDARKPRAKKTSIALVPRLDLDTICLLYALLERRTTMVLLHPRLTTGERAELVRDAKPDLVIEDPAVAQRATRSNAARIAAVQTPPGDTGDDDDDDDDESAACLAVLYTSGTTGRPKGAMLSRRAFLAAAEASTANLGWQRDDRWLLCMPLAHVGGLSIVVRCLIARSCVVIPESTDVDTLRHVIGRDRVTLASLVPTVLKRLLDDDHHHHEPSGCWETVRAVLLGGAGAPKSLLDMARTAKVPVLTTYGLTEACSQVTTQRFGTEPSIEQGSGHPIRGTEIRISNEDGRIEIRGPSLMTGYIGDRKPMTAAPFLRDGWLRTEDFGRFDEEGRLHVLGRSEELVVTGGENVYPLEVERHLDAIPGIRSSCVFGVPDDTWGEIVCAAFVLESPVMPADLFAAFESRLAAHRRPRRVAILDGFPSTAAGKLDRRGVMRLATPQLVGKAGSSR
jgi:o-succinylbenzoate---CoA ligase